MAVKELLRFERRTKASLKPEAFAEASLFSSSCHVEVSGRKVSEQSFRARLEVQFSQAFSTGSVTGFRVSFSLPGITALVAAPASD